MKILIVDDEEMIRGVLREYVEFEGNEAFEAENGMEAVKLCRENDYDLVLMDIMMPQLDGFSAVKEIKKCKDVPVIMLSARGEEYDKLFAFEIGVDDYVTKPFSPKEVMARINAVTKRHKQKQNGNEILRFEGLEIEDIHLTYTFTINNQGECPIVAAFEGPGDLANGLIKTTYIQSGPGQEFEGSSVQIGLASTATLKLRLTIEDSTGFSGEEFITFSIIINAVN